MAGIAILGAGIFATECHLPSCKNVGASVKAVYSRSAGSAQKLLSAAEELGFPHGSIDLYSDESGEGHRLDDLLKRNDIQGCIIVLPILVQPDVVRKCLAAGKHVLCEKPIAKDVKSARELVADYQKDYLPRGLVFSIAEQFRYLKWAEQARKWVVEDKLIGDLKQVHARSWGYVEPGGKYYETAWRKVPEYQGGFLLDGGVHQVAAVRYIAGQEIVETRSFAHQLAEHLPPTDTVNAGILFSGGAVGTFSMSFASAKPEAELLFVGDKGSLTVKSDSSLLTLKDKEQKVLKEETVENDGVDAEVQAFIEAIAAGKNEDRAGPIEALNDVAVIQSLVSGGGKVELWQS